MDQLSILYYTHYSICIWLWLIIIMEASERERKETTRREREVRIIVIASIKNTYMYISDDFFNAASSRTQHGIIIYCFYVCVCVCAHWKRGILYLCRCVFVVFVCLCSMGIIVEMIRFSSFSIDLIVDRSSYLARTHSFNHQHYDFITFLNRSF